jgi:uncharacterized protein (TIGR02118 family)
MIKLVYCITRRPGMSQADFSDYFENVHGPIGRRIPGLRRLVQNYSLPPDDDTRPGFDGMAELWFDDTNALTRARRSPEWEASTADEENFIDHSRVAYFICEEKEIS